MSTSQWSAPSRTAKSAASRPTYPTWDGMDAFFPIRLPNLTSESDGQRVPVASLDSDFVPAHIDSYPDRGAVYL